MGYDVAAGAWPGFLDDLGCPREWFPEVIGSGRPVGQLRSVLSQAWGLPDDVVVASGITDSNAVHISSGSVRVGEWTTTIGSAMGIKGTAAEPFVDESGSFYSHRHPDGHWMPGGASAVGGAALNKRFGLDALTALEESFAEPPRTDCLVYPLEGKGDWFPRWLPEATGFATGRARSAGETLWATYEGIAFVERMAYDRILDAGGEVTRVAAAGGTNRSRAFLSIRAALLPCPVCRVSGGGAARGAALLAAMAVEGKSLVNVASRMVSPAAEVSGQALDAAYLEAKYRRFVDELERRFGGNSHAEAPAHHSENQEPVKKP
jgi:sugar (pentulose or hexulose) kinase